MRGNERRFVLTSLSDRGSGPERRVRAGVDRYELKQRSGRLFLRWNYEYRNSIA
jgi:hypothetical protein